MTSSTPVKAVKTTKAPGPRQLPFAGYAAMIRRDRLNFFIGLAREYGDVVSFKVLGYPAFLFSHPDHVREILVTRQQNFTKSPVYQRMKRFLGDGLLTIEGEDHKRHRRLLQPAFHRERLQSYAAIMSSYACQTRDRLKAHAEVDMHREMTRVSLAIVTRALFDSDVEGDAKEVGKALGQLENSFRLSNLPFAQFFRRLGLPQYRRAELAPALVNRTVERIIAQRMRDEGRAAGGSNDLLSTLISLRDEDGSRLSAGELRDEILTLFIAGSGTSSLTLTWTWYLLARNPACEARLHEEIDSVLQGRMPDFDDLPRLPFTQSVVNESMRLYPPIWLLGRQTKEDFAAGGYEIPAGSICLVSPWLMHRDPRWYPEPDRFDPGRWSPEQRDSRPKFTYFPFGGGSRVCIGERFALAQIILVMVTLAQKWRFRMVSGEPVKTLAQISLQPAAPVRMIAEPRG